MQVMCTPRRDNHNITFPDNARTVAVYDCELRAWDQRSIKAVTHSAQGNRKIGYTPVAPAKAGVQRPQSEIIWNDTNNFRHWIPTFAGMTATLR